MQYIEIPEGFNFDQDDKAIVATRQYVGIEDDADLPAGDSGVSLPNIGDPLFSSDDEDGLPQAILDIAQELGVYGASGDQTPHLICRKRTVTIPQRDSRKVMIAVSYSNEIVDMHQFSSDQTAPREDVTSLPQQVEMDGEFQLYNPNVAQAAGDQMPWQWANEDGDPQPTKDPVLEPIPFRIRTFTMTVEVIVGQDQYDDYVQSIKDKMKTVNDADIEEGPLKGGRGCWLFTSARSECYSNHLDIQSWRFSLVFNYRDPDGTDNMGQQKILRRTGVWSIPINTTGEEGNNYMYDMTDISSLLTLVDTGT